MKYHAHLSEADDESQGLQALLAGELAHFRAEQREAYLGT